MGAKNDAIFHLQFNTLPRRSLLIVGFVNNINARQLVFLLYLSESLPCE